MMAASSSKRPHPQRPAAGGQIHDAAQLFKAAADFAALPRHGLQQKRGGLIRGKHLVQGVGDKGDARPHALAHVAARVHVVQLARGVLHAHEVVGQQLDGELARLGLGRRRVHGVGGVGQKRGDAVLARKGVEGRHIGRIDGLGTTAPWVAREELEGVPVDGRGILGHLQISLGTGQMTTDGEHGAILSTGVT